MREPSLAAHETEAFTMDDLGNRSNVKLRNDDDEAYVADNLTNRYNSVAGNNMSYDAAGNTTKDKDGYEYQYDYENRIVKITKNSGATTIAEFAYDALGRRIRKIDSVNSKTTLFLHNYNWQVLTEADGSGTKLRVFVYGNYIDEPLLMRNFSDNETKIANKSFYYVQDALYNCRGLLDGGGVIGQLRASNKMRLLRFARSDKPPVIAKEPKATAAISIFHEKYAFSFCCRL